MFKIENMAGTAGGETEGVEENLMNSFDKDDENGDSKNYEESKNVGGNMDDKKKYDDDDHHHHYDDNEDVIIEGRMVYLPSEAEHHQLMIKIGLPALGHLIKKIILMIIVCYHEMGTKMTMPYL